MDTRLGVEGRRSADPQQTTLHHLQVENLFLNVLCTRQSPALTCHGNRVSLSALNLK